MITVQLHFSGPEARLATLAPLTGREEVMVAPNGGFRATVALVETLSGCNVAPLAVADFERIVAALHRDVWGPEVECRADCVACGATFAFGLALEAVTPQPPADQARASSLKDTGTLPGPSGITLRAPRVADLLAADRPAMLAACFPFGRAGFDEAAQEDALAEAFPTGADEVEAACPECGASQNLQFDLCLHIAALIGIERPFLLREVHALADRYHWQLAEILSLTRADRRALVRLVLEAEARETRRRLQ